MIHGIALRIDVTLCVVSRENGDIEELKAKAEELGKFGRILVSEVQPTEVSSTEVRKKIAKNKDFTCYLDKNVVQYIRSGNLYADEKADKEAES